MQESWNEEALQSNDLVLMRELTELVRNAILQLGDSPNDELVQRMIDEMVLDHPSAQYMSSSKKHFLSDGIFNATRKELDLLQPYAEDEEVSEIMVNGTDNIFIERNGILEKLAIRFEQREDLEEVIRRLAARVHREINELNPIVDARMADGSRVNAVYHNVALNGPTLTIRKFPEQSITMEELLLKGTLTEDAAQFLKKMVRGGYNIFLSGGTSSGKTTLLGVLSTFIPPEERVIVIEDSAELQINKIENIVRMETRTANAQGKGEVTAQQLIKTSLRMRPDRILVGEVRGEEVLDMIQAMNTGHDGSLSTGHGNSPAGMLRRLEAMFLTAADFPIDAIRSQIAEGLDLIVHLSRMPDRSRKIIEITEIEDYVDGQILLNPLYRFHSGSGLERNGNVLKNQVKLKMRGIQI